MEKLTANQKKTFAAQIKALDPKGEITRLDFTRLQRDFHNRLWGGAKIGVNIQSVGIN